MMTGKLVNDEPRHMGPGVSDSPILVVDDRHENLVALEAVLEPLAVRVTTARSGEAALRQLLKEDFALILLDVQMPGLDGFATARLIKEHPRTRHLPIIFLTAFDERLDHADKGYSFGAVDYIAKPFDPWILRSKVQVFLDLHQKTALLEHQTDVLEARLEELRASRAALADAQRIAQLGSWELDPATGKIDGSDQLRVIFGRPVREPLPHAAELFAQLRFPQGRRDRIDLAHPTTQVNVEAELMRPEGHIRQVVINAEPINDEHGGAVRVIGTVQDVTQQWEAARALVQATTALEQERELVYLLQQAVAPPELPHVPELDIAHSYRAAAPGLVGGDWYDVLQLSDGNVLLVIGDVAGHGLPAASTMSQIRTALRVAALRETAPSALLSDVDRYLSSAVAATFATMMIARLDPVNGVCTIASAGHLPVLLCGNDYADFEWIPIGPPLGTGPGHHYSDATFTLPPGASMVLYTDGLIERRGEIVDDGLARLRAAVKQPSDTSTSLADHVMQQLCASDEPSDDVALLVVRRREPSTTLQLRLPAQASELASMRLTLRRWLAPLDPAPQHAADIVLAVSELATNVCLHAYPRFSPGVLMIDGTVDHGDVRIEIRDQGRWKSGKSKRGGRGLDLVRALGLSLHVDPREHGTTATIRTNVRSPNQPALD